MLPILFLIALLWESSLSITSFILNASSPVTVINRINEKPLFLRNLKIFLRIHLITIKQYNMGSSSSTRKKVAPSFEGEGYQRYLMLNFNWASKRIHPIYTRKAKLLNLRNIELSFWSEVSHDSLNLESKTAKGKNTKT